MSILKKIKNRLFKYWYKPIPVFLFHQVGNNFNPMIDKKNIHSTMDLFRENISLLKKRYNFISLEAASELLQKKSYKSKRYAVITFDDAFSSIQEPIEFLLLSNIPFTIFVNSEYMEGEIRREIYLTREQIFSLNNPLISIGMHGYKHYNSMEISFEEFEQNVIHNYNDLKKHPGFIPFFAYPYGAFSDWHLSKIKEIGFVPVLCNGDFNRGKEGYISRHCIDGVNLKERKIFWI